MLSDVGFQIEPVPPLLLDHTHAYHPDMQVQLSHPSRTVAVKGPKRAKDLLRELNLVIEAHLVIRGDELVTEDEMLLDQDQIEIRPVISGG
jgi:Sulfur transfer protein involved in thiamine biosynthesis